MGMPFKGVRKTGCAFLAWTAFALFAAFLVYFAYQVWFYADKLRGGEVIALPQFRSSLTRAAGGGGSNFIARDIVEDPTSPSSGPEDALLTIVEFGDFECPYSRTAASVVRSMAARYGDRVRIIYRDYPLTDIHGNAFMAAEASECAFEQAKFWEYYDKLYLGSGTLDFSRMVQYAAEVGMDVSAFEKCLIEERYKAQVQKDLATAQTLSLEGTPTFFFNGMRVGGAIPEELFVSIIEKLLRRK